MVRVVHADFGSCLEHVAQFFALSRLRAMSRVDPKIAMALPSMSTQMMLLDAGVAPPVSGGNGLGSGVGAGMAAGEPALPTAIWAGKELNEPQTMVSPLEFRRTELESMVRVSSLLIATSATSDSLDLSSTGNGMHTVAALSKMYDETMVPPLSTADIA